MIIKSITLLSEEEFNSYKDFTPQIDHQIWWLRTAYYLPHRACAVFANSYVGNAPVSSYAIGVRPALIIENENFELCQRLEALGYSWTVLSVQEESAYVLCDEIVAHHRFDDEQNDFETSEIKRFLEGWLKEIQKTPVNAMYTYKIKFGTGYATGSVSVPIDATDDEIKLAIFDALEDVSYKKLK